MELLEESFSAEMEEGQEEVPPISILTFIWASLLLKKATNALFFHF